MVGGEERISFFKMDCKIVLETAGVKTGDNGKLWIILDLKDNEEGDGKGRFLGIILDKPTFSVNMN